MYPALIAAFNFSAMADPITDPTNHPLGAAGWLAAVYAVLRIIYANYADKLPGFITTLLSKIPGFPPVLQPIVQLSLVEILKLLDAHLKEQEVPATERAAILKSVADTSGPAVTKALLASFQAEVAGVCKTEG